MNDIVIVRYGETALKSKNIRRRFEDVTIKNILYELSRQGIPYEGVVRDWGRIFVKSKDVRAPQAIARVFGVVSSSHASSTCSDLGEICRLGLEVIGPHINNIHTFAVRCRRFGDHQYTSRDVCVDLGAAVLNTFDGLKVDLTSPDLELRVEIREDKSYVFLDKVKGVGGLPYGTQGKMLAMISGGIDSPVAAWLMMKRGCEITPVFFDNSPFADDATRTRALETIKALQSYAPVPFTVYEVPHGESLISILQNCRRKMTCVMCRRTMYKATELIANEEGYQGIITGSSLGQVASQTPKNLMATSYGISVPIYHPLIGLDKTEITDMARGIGTYTTSSTPASCCSSVPRHPELRAEVPDTLEQEIKADVDNAVKIALSGVRKYVLEV